VQPDPDELASVVKLLKSAKNPVIVAGGGVHYAAATQTLRLFAESLQIPVVETQAGKSALPWDHPMNLGPVGVTGAASANDMCGKADLVLGIGTRFQDFTTGSWSLFSNPNRTLVSLNVAAYDAMKHSAEPLCCDAEVGLAALSNALGSFRFTPPDATLKTNWFAQVDPLTAPPADGNQLPTDMQVIGAVQRASTPDTVIMSAAGTMPGELHKLWKATRPMSYHMEYGFSCMGYEIAGALGIKMAEPQRDVVCMIGDGSYMMANSELATACMMGLKITLVITDNRGFGCINRLQMGTGGAEFNNLLKDAYQTQPSNIDFTAHAAAMGATAVKVTSISELETALENGKTIPGPYVVVIDTDPYPSTHIGGSWWEVGVPEVSVRPAVNAARVNYEIKRKQQRSD
jgi:3D-(3,5/4)-trihydroxycyclohexane-1,2-dione acylhydrolase (decyclizing)